VLDLGTSDGLTAARRLARRADVVVENFRPETMDRLGLGYEQLKVANPGLVYCSVTGFGAGSDRALPGYDLLVPAVGGLMSVTGRLRRSMIREHDRWRPTAQRGSELPDPLS
jgi:crotonobetainyl-CoA:carnitine CoA-transferase CaiB-like acyl-CoA transferase